MRYCSPTMAEVLDCAPKSFPPVSSRTSYPQSCLVPVPVLSRLRGAFCAPLLSISGAKLLLDRDNAHLTPSPLLSHMEKGPEWLPHSLTAQLAGSLMPGQAHLEPCFPAQIDIRLLGFRKSGNARLDFSNPLDVPMLIISK